MSIDHVLAVVPVSDFDASHSWYERLYGVPATNLPMPGQLVEWQVSPNGWVQITHDPERAGSTLLNFAVDDLDLHIARLRQRDLVVGSPETANKNVLLASINDRDGNTITFIGNFRINY